MEIVQSEPDYYVYNANLKERPFDLSQVSLKDLSFTYFDLVIFVRKDWFGMDGKLLYIRVIKI